MPVTTTELITDRPTAYIEQLTSHPAPDTTAAMTLDGRGTLTFDRGTCVVRRAGLRRLEFVVSAEDFAALTSIQDSVARELLRHADDEELDLAWTEPLTGDDIQTLDPVVSNYLLAHCTPADELLQELVVTTREITGRAAGMQVSHDEGVFLSMLTSLVGARFAVEVGVFTGYSSLCIARALPADGRLLALDVSEEWTSVGQEFWQRAGVADRIELKIGPALDALRALPTDQTIDIAFIDADKTGYPAYYEEIVTRLRPGGLVVLDNVFLGGGTLDPACQEKEYVTMRGLNDLIAADPRVESVMLPVRDGVTLARKR